MTLPVRNYTTNPLSAKKLYWVYGRLYEMTRGVDLSAYDTAPTDPDAPPIQMFHDLYDRLEAHGFVMRPFDEAARYSREQRRTFAPAMAPSVHDGLPGDAWIPFLGGRSGPVSTRADVRPFSVEEQRRILAAGACLTCHEGDSRVMQDAIDDWDGTLRRVSARCILPL